MADQIYAVPRVRNLTLAAVADCSIGRDTRNQASHLACLKELSSALHLLHLRRLMLHWHLRCSFCETLQAQECVTKLCAVEWNSCLRLKRICSRSLVQPWAQSRCWLHRVIGMWASYSYMSCWMFWMLGLCSLMITSSDTLFHVTLLLQWSLSLFNIYGKIILLVKLHTNVVSLKWLSESRTADVLTCYV